MRFGAGVSKLIVFAMLVTLVFPFAAITASAQDAVALNVPLDVQDLMQAEQLLSDVDVLNYLESELLTTNKSTRQGIVQSNNERLMFIKKNRDKAGQDHYQYQKTINGVPVYGEYARIHLDPNRRVNLVQNGLSAEQNTTFRTTPVITAEAALQSVISDIELEIGQAIDLDARIGALERQEPVSTLMIYPFNSKKVLVYEIKLDYIKPVIGSWVAYVDAMTGAVIKRYSKINHSHDLNPERARVGSGLGTDDNLKALNLYQNDGSFSPIAMNKYFLVDITKPMFVGYHDENFVDNIIWTSNWNALTDEEDSFFNTTIDDRDAVDAHYNTGLVYDFYKNAFDWDGITGVGGSIVSFVHAEEFEGVPLDNAFWNGLALFYGDGSGSVNGGFNCTACALDVVAHEFTHAVTQYSADLYYEFETGALNESISDIMAVIVDNDDWTIGEDTLSEGAVLRNLADPGASNVIEPQPAHMVNYNDLSLSDDNGGIHINSGIPNHAAYLMATGLDAFFDDAANNNLNLLDGRTLLGELTFDILNNYLTPTSDFADARDSYIGAANNYVATQGVSWSGVQRAAFVEIIEQAWTSVGVLGLSILDIESASGRPAYIDNYKSVANFYVPYGTVVTNIEPTITTSVYTSYTSDGGIGPKDFSGDRTVTYTVYANDDPSYNQAWTVGVIEEPILNYSSTAFSEASANDGTISNSITVTLINDVFSGPINIDYVAEKMVFIDNLPSGLTAEVIKTSNTNVTISLKGIASAHANTNDISNVEVFFTTYAFNEFYDYQVMNSAQALSIDFADPAVTSPGPSPGFFIPTDPEPEVTEDGIVYKPSEEETEVVTDENGRTTMNVTLSDNSVDDLIDQLEEEGSEQEITISLVDDSDKAQLQISAANLLKIAASSPSAVIIVKSGSASYQLPIGLIDLDALATELTGTTSTLNIKVSMEKISGDVRSSFLTSASKAGASLLGDAIDFSIVAESNGTSKEIKDFGKTYVNRTITVNGSISPFNASVVVFNPTTNRISFVPATFKDVDGNTEVTIKRNGNSIYAVVQTKKIYFNDVQKHWASKDIEFLASRMIISGFNESTFKPNDNITRAQFVTMLVQALGLTANEDVDFSDIPADAWYRGYVGAAVNSGITTGVGGNEFKPNALITREEMAVMVANTLAFLNFSFDEAETTALLAHFQDNHQISSWARNSVAAAYDAGVIKGMDPVTFAPQNKATRAQAAVMIRGLLTSVDFVN